MRMRELEAAERARKQRTERQRIRELIHDYCFGEMAGKGCVNCPINKANACDEVRGKAIILPIERLRAAEKLIKEGRQ